MHVEVRMTHHGTESEESWLGLDLGTQSVRAIAVSSAGTVSGSGSYALKSHREEDRHEQDAGEWWRAVIAACRLALDDLSPASVRGVAVDSTSGTILCVDRRGSPVTPGLMYDDARAGSESRRVNEIGAEVWSSLGYRMQPSWALPKLLWLLHTHDSFAPGSLFIHQTDFINWQLVGHKVATDSSTALKTGYDLLHDSWPHSVLAQLDVPEAMLLDVVRPGTQLGTVCAQAAEATGIPEGIPVIAGMTDGCAAQIGAGALRVGSWNAVLGTTLVLKGVTQELVRDPAGVVYSHRSPDGTWLPGGASSTGAAALTTYFPGRSLDELNVRAAEREPASVITYPLVSHGERFPFSAPAAEGFTLGEPADEIDRYAALLQGVAFIERLCFDYLDMLGAPTDGEFRLTGGGTRSRYWSQLRADVLEHSVDIPENAEPALGMAILAASAGRPLAEVAASMVRMRETIEPRLDRIERFHAPYMRLVDELEKRGWLPQAVAEHARRRVAR